MPGNSMQLLNNQLPDSAGEHPERELLKRIDARDGEAMRRALPFALSSSDALPESDDAPPRTYR
jgi:hypothetical protein